MTSLMRRGNYSVNPGNKSWNSGVQKFGQKMMQRFGWTHGTSPRFKGYQNQQHYQQNPNYTVGYANETMRNKKRKMGVAQGNFTVKRRKTVAGNTGVSNPAFDPFYNNVAVEKHVLNPIQEYEDEIEENIVVEAPQTNESQVTEVKQKKKEKPENGVENLNFVLNDEDQHGVETTDSHEVKRKTKKKKKKTEAVGVTNAALDLSNEAPDCPENNVLEVKREEQSGLDNPAFNISDGDIMLNVTDTPVEREQKNELFDINQRVIDNSRRCGQVNRGFNMRPTRIQERVRYARRTIENCAAEVENELNEKKHYPTVGENGDPDGENEQVEEGTKLKFKYASFSQRTPWYHIKAEGAKKSYKHLIKGDIIVAFKNTNLHEIKGYAAEKKQNSEAVVMAAETKAKRRPLKAVVRSTKKTNAQRVGFVVKKRTAFVAPQIFVKPRRLKQRNQQQYFHDSSQQQYQNFAQNQYEQQQDFAQNYQRRQRFPQNQQQPTFPQNEQWNGFQQFDQNAVPQNFEQNHQQHYQQHDFNAQVNVRPRVPRMKRVPRQNHFQNANEAHFIQNRTPPQYAQQQQFQPENVPMKRTPTKIFRPRNNYYQQQQFEQNFQQEPQFATPPQYEQSNYEAHFSPAPPKPAFRKIRRNYHQQFQNDQAQYPQQQPQQHFSPEMNVRPKFQRTGRKFARQQVNYQHPPQQRNQQQHYAQIHQPPHYV